MQKTQLQKEIQWLLKEKYRGKTTPAAKGDIARLKRGDSVDYLIGFVEFAGCKIDLSFKPFIPRPETEYWVEKSIEEIKYKIPARHATRQQLRSSGRVVDGQNTRYPSAMPCKALRAGKIQALDMFAGSGCIGTAVLKHIPQAHVDFAENEKKFLQQIHLNLRKSRISKKRFRIVQSNIFSGVSLKYDYIFANPPYVAESRRKTVQPSVLKHEPGQALFAGKDGLKYIRRFLKEAKTCLKPSGTMYLEFDSPQRKEINGLLKKYNYSSWQFYKDQYKKWRFVVVEN